MQKAFALLEQLQDGRAHSGEAIAERLGVSRNAVWNQIKRLQAEGVEIHAVTGKGYRLPGGYEFLDADVIQSRMTAGLSALYVDRVTDSTNQRLLDLSIKQSIHNVAWIAEFQTRGRGRRGGTWLAPPGSGLCLSLGWRFETPPAALPALSLAVGVAVIKALEKIGASGIQLKWPNDLYFNDRKLAGILIEMRSEFGGPCTVVIGMGVNIQLSHGARERIQDLATDVASACNEPPSRNESASVILDHLTLMLSEFGTVGFEPHLAVWQQHDLLNGRRIRLEMPGRNVTGIARGVGADGTLIIEHNGQQESFLAGHVVMSP